MKAKKIAKRRIGHVVLVLSLLNVGWLIIHNLRLPWKQHLPVTRSPIILIQCNEGILWILVFALVCIPPKQRRAFVQSIGPCTAKALDWKLKKNIPRNETARHRSQFLHSTCEKFIYSHDWSAYFAAGKYLDRAWEYKCKSLTDTWMWKLGTRPRSFISVNTWIGSCLQCGFCSSLSYIYITAAGNQLATEQFLPVQTVLSGKLEVRTAHHSTNHIWRATPLQLS
jgi:hypothetical protein